MKSLLVLGGHPLLGRALTWAREAGLASVLAEPDSRAVHRRLAHEFHPIPDRDVRDHAALTRRLRGSQELAGVLITDRRGLGILATLGDDLPGLCPPGAALRRTLDPRVSREQWRAAGLPVVDEKSEPATRWRTVCGYFRDGALVPAGVSDHLYLGSAERRAPWSAQPSSLDESERARCFTLAERAARTLGIELGPVEVRLSWSLREPELVSLFPGFADVVGACCVAPLVYGKSPIQAWMASLTEAGGPFDSMPLEPLCSAGWLAIRAEGAGIVGGFEGVARARALPGVVDLWLEEPGREVGHGLAPEGGSTCGYLWARADDAAELERCLAGAGARIEVRLARRQVA